MPTTDDLDPTTPALTQERVRQLLGAQPWELLRRDDGVPFVLLEANQVMFKAANNNLLIHGDWHMALAPEHRDRLVAQLDAHNTAHPNLKAFILPSGPDEGEDDRLFVRAEAPTSFHQGAADLQLHWAIDRALADMRQLFAQLRYAFDLAEQAAPQGAPWYTPPTLPAEPALPAVDLDRVEAVFKARDWNFERSDTELTSSWRVHLLHFSVPAPGQLRVSASSRRRFPPSARAVVQDAIQRYHHRTLWPTLSVEAPQAEDDSCAVLGIYEADLGAGASDAQLEHQLRVAIHAAEDFERAIRWADADQAQDPLQPQELSQERLVALLEENGWSYFTDSDDDLGAFFNNDLFYFFLDNNTRFIIRGHWHLSLRPEHAGRLMQRLNDWNQKKFWPKAYYVVQDKTSRLLVQTEVSIDYDYGANDAQLLHHIRCALGTSRELFDHLLSAFEV